jgi:hypothetical protein
MAAAKTATTPQLSSTELKRTAQSALADLKKTESKNPRRTTLARRLAQTMFDELQEMKSNEYSWTEISQALAKKGLHVKPADLQGALAKEKYQRKQRTGEVSS